MLFSATFSERVENFASRFAPNANEIRLRKEEVSLDAIKQFFMGMLLLACARMSASSP